MKHLILIGFMGSGKSSLASNLSRELLLPVFSTDLAISEQLQMSISDIFSHFGEEFFRAQESRIFAAIKQLEAVHIIDCGGGFGYYQEVNALGKVIFLDLEFEEILQRMNEDERSKRPLFGNEAKAKELFLQRREVYLAKADIRLKSLKDLKEQINALLP